MVGSRLSLYPVDNDVLGFDRLELDRYGGECLNLSYKNIWRKDASAYETTSYQPTDLKMQREHSSNLTYKEPKYNDARELSKLKHVTMEAILRRAWEDKVYESQ